MTDCIPTDIPMGPHGQALETEPLNEDDYYSYQSIVGNLSRLTVKIIPDIVDTASALVSLRSRPEPRQPFSSCQKAIKVL